MLSSIYRPGLLAAVAAILSAAGYSVTAMANQPSMISEAPRPVRASKRSLFGGIRASTSLHGRKGAGVSMAQQQRRAAKARNVARNRRHHR
jgi:hypothetical protein